MSLLGPLRRSSFVLGKVGFSHEKRPDTTELLYKENGFLLKCHSLSLRIPTLKEIR